MGGPYRIDYWELGAHPRISIDVPVTLSFLFLFLVGAVTHFTLLQINRRRKRQFFLTIFLVAFSMSRVIACSLRIAIIYDPQNLKVTIASTVFLNAGPVLIYLLNLALTHRIIRALYPRTRRHASVFYLFMALSLLTVLIVAMVLTAIVQSFFTLNANTHRIDRNVQLAGLTYFVVVSFLPLPLAIYAILPQGRRGMLSYFGHHKPEANAMILAAGTLFICLGATYRCATTWLQPVSFKKPEPDYDNIGCFYVFYFTMDVLVIFLYGIGRIDQLFFVADAAEEVDSDEPKNNQMQPDFV